MAKCSTFAGPSPSASRRRRRKIASLGVCAGRPDALRGRISGSEYGRKPISREMPQARKKRRSRRSAHRDRSLGKRLTATSKCSRLRRPRSLATVRSFLAVFFSGE